jgi:ABC-type transporter MlaC component
MRQNSDGQWRIFDVFLEGKFSELSRQRSEYASVLQSGGIDALIFALDANSDQIEGRNMRK